MYLHLATMVPDHIAEPTLETPSKLQPVHEQNPASHHHDLVQTTFVTESYALTLLATWP